MSAHLRRPLVRDSAAGPEDPGGDDRGDDRAGGAEHEIAEGTPAAPDVWVTDSDDAPEEGAPGTPHPRTVVLCDAPPSVRKNGTVYLLRTQRTSVLREQLRGVLASWRRVEPGGASP